MKAARAAVTVAAALLAQAAQALVVRHDVECSPCMLPRCKWTGADELKCLRLLTPEQVVQTARELVGL